jgi:hypothetical protein
MKNVLRVMFVFVLVLGAASAYAGEATQMWRCEMEDDTTEAQVMKSAKDWLAAAKTMKGGENLQATVLFPVAVNDAQDTDLFFVITAPTFEEWGKFWDGYMGSAAEKVDNANDEFVACPDSAVWESIQVK